MYDLCFNEETEENISDNEDFCSTFPQPFYF